MQRRPGLIWEWRLLGFVLQCLTSFIWLLQNGLRSLLNTCGSSCRRWQSFTDSLPARAAGLRCLLLLLRWKPPWNSGSTTRSWPCSCFRWVGPGFIYRCSAAVFMWCRGPSECNKEKWKYVRQKTQGVVHQKKKKSSFIHPRHSKPIAIFETQVKIFLLQIFFIGGSCDRTDWNNDNKVTDIVHY